MPSLPSPVAAAPTASPIQSAELYLRVRAREGRLYSDEIVARLPDFPAEHPLKKEWLARVDSADRLLRYLVKLPPPLQVLDLGCGNGWLSHLVSRVPNLQVWGLDRFGPELTQAARLFAADNTAFLAADIAHAPFPRQFFDVIILASVIQYFPDLAALMQWLRPLLKSDGEIHVLDSPVYGADDVEAARRRTDEYYSALGFPDMSESYFHHTRAALNDFNPQYLYHPGGLGARLQPLLGRAASPFPWIRIRRVS